MLVQAMGIQNKHKNTHYKRQKLTTGLKNKTFYSLKQTAEEGKRQDRRGRYVKVLVFRSYESSDKFTNQKDK